MKSKKMTKDYFILAGYHILTMSVVGINYAITGFSNAASSIRELVASRALDHAARMVDDYAKEDSIPVVFPDVVSKKDQN